MKIEDEVIFDAEGNDSVESYTDCKILCKIERKSSPITSTVELDDCTDMVQENFDYTFKGVSEFYPYQLPKEVLNLDVNMIVIVGASGSGKSTLLKEFSKDLYKFSTKSWNNSKAIVSNFKSKEDARDRLSSVGLNSMPVWCKPRNVLSVGEGFRADIALNIDSYTIFDEFTSTIDRNVAKSTCNGINKYVHAHNLRNVVFCSCHKDFIEYLSPDIVIDLDDELVYDCRGIELKKASLFKCTKLATKTFGEFLGNIII